MGDEAFTAPLVEAFTELLKPAKARFYIEREQGRVQELVRRMGEYERAERNLSQAQMAFSNGNTACLEETIIAPTPELLASGEFERFTADTVKGTVRSASTVRRKLMNHVVKYYVNGLIDDDELTACRWYKDVYERTGLTGNIPSTDYGKQVFAAPQSRSMFTDWQIDTQDMFRGVRLQMTKRWLPFFDAIVLHDQAPKIALRLSRGNDKKVNVYFRDAAQELTAAYHMLKKGV